MIKIAGYSLIELLLSLFLISSTILVLMRYHWQINQQLNQAFIDFYTFTETDNQKEQQLSKKTNSLSVKREGQ